MVNQINGDVSVFIVDTRLCDSQDNLTVISEELVYRVQKAAELNIPLLFSTWGNGSPIQTFNENFTSTDAIALLSTATPLRGGNLRSLKNFNEALSSLPINHHVKIHVIATEGFTSNILTDQPRLAHLNFILDPLTVQHSLLVELSEEFTVESLAKRHPKHEFPSVKRMKMNTE